MKATPLAARSPGAPVSTGSGKSYRPPRHRWACSASVVRLRPLCLGMAVVLTALLWRASASGEETSKAQAAWGIAVGWPQMVALTVEGPASWPVRAHAHAGGVPTLGASLGLRVIVDPIRARIRPYGFLGAGYGSEVGGEGMGPCTGHDGAFGCVGGGLRLRIWRFTLSGDIGALSWRSSCGYDHGDAVSVGIAYDLW